jgi:hypothetical protein
MNDSASTSTLPEAPRPKRRYKAWLGPMAVLIILGAIMTWAWRPFIGPILEVSDCRAKQALAEAICRGEFGVGGYRFRRITRMLHSRSYKTRLRGSWLVSSRDMITAGPPYRYVPDAFLDAGRGADLQAGLYHAWQQTEEGTFGRYYLASRYVDFRRRQYLWDHPEFDDPVEIRRNVSDYKGFYDYESNKWHILDNALLKSGDAEFAEVFENYEHHVDLLKTGKLTKPEGMWM